MRGTQVAHVVAATLGTRDQVIHRWPIWVALTEQAHVDRMLAQVTLIAIGRQHPAQQRLR
jgi:hypothetical protein